MSDHLAGYYTTLYSYNSLIVSICAYNKGFPILPRCTFFIRTRQVYFVTTDYHSNGYIFSSLPGCPVLEASRGAAREINSETFMTFPTRQVVRFRRLLYKTMSLRSPSGGAAMGGIAAHGYVNGKTGAARQG